VRDRVGAGKNRQKLTGIGYFDNVDRTEEIGELGAEDRTPVRSPTPVKLMSTLMLTSSLASAALVVRAQASTFSFVTLRRATRPHADRPLRDSLELLPA
jgi:hypothetical protein